jgi:hypothetical protein
MQLLPVEEIEALATEYRRLWPLMPVLHSRVAKLAGKEAIRACAKRLRMFNKQGNKLGIHFAHELEIDVFQDYLLYMYRPRGFSLVRQMLNRNRYPQGSDEQMLLAGMAQARFSLFWIKELDPAGGFLALDIISGKDFFILDQSLPQQDARGMLMSFRIFPLRNVWMHTGANMSFGQIDDPKKVKPLNCLLSENEERQLNEDNFLYWRELLREMDEGENQRGSFQGTSMGVSRQ